MVNLIERESEKDNLSRELSELNRETVAGRQNGLGLEGSLKTSDQRSARPCDSGGVEARGRNLCGQKSAVEIAKGRCSLLSTCK